jgi:acetyltransferase-like isoleucine patch superfamily enzyme
MGHLWASNSTLVAPLEIGPGLYVAAGSVVTQGGPSGCPGDRPGKTGKQAGMGAAQPGQAG